MVETLTTKNLELGERCGELEAIISDLESSVELSEELEMEQAEEIQELQVALEHHRPVTLYHQYIFILAIAYCYTITYLVLLNAGHADLNRCRPKRISFLPL